MLSGALRTGRGLAVALAGAGAVFVLVAERGAVFLETVQSLTEALAERGYQLMLGQAGYTGNREDALLEAIIGRRPDGIVLTGIMHSAQGRKRLLASKAGYGFVMPEEEALATRKAGKQVLNGVANICLEVAGDQVAVVGDNGKILFFPLEELPEMPRGKGVKLQSYREGGLRDGMLFAAEAGAAWTDGAGRARAWPEWRDWAGKRACLRHTKRRTCWSPTRL